MSSRTPNPWEAELAAALEAHRPSLAWLTGHLARLIGPSTELGHLVSMASDLCDAGHVHLDIVLWVLTEDLLHAVLVSEEHYDRGPEEVDTTFETNVSVHPLDTIAGTQLATASHPDGHQVDVSLAVMLATTGLSGHADPVTFEDPELPSFAIGLQPTPLSFTVPAERTGEVAGFARQILLARSAGRAGGASPRRR